MKTEGSQDPDKVTVPQETFLPLGGLELWDGVVTLDDDGVPEVWVECCEKGLGDEAAGCEVVLG